MVRGEGKKVRVARRIRWVAASMVEWLWSRGRGGVSEKVRLRKVEREGRPNLREVGCTACEPAAWRGGGSNEESKSATSTQTGNC